MESVWSVSKLSTESVGRGREPVANSVHFTASTPTRRNSTVLNNCAHICALNDASNYFYNSVTLLK